MGLCLLDWMSADLSSLMQTANHLLDLASERHLIESVAWARYFRGCVAYQRNDMARAESEFAAVVGQRYGAHGVAFSQSAFRPGIGVSGTGPPGQARAVVASALAYSLETNTSSGPIEAQVFQMRLLQQQGQAITAQQSAPVPRGSAARAYAHVRLHPLCAWLGSPFGRGTTESLLSASLLCLASAVFCETTRNTFFRFEVLPANSLHEHRHESTPRRSTR